MLNFTSVPSLETVTFSLPYCQSHSLPTNLTSEHEIPPLVFTEEAMYFNFLVMHLVYMVSKRKYYFPNMHSHLPAKSNGITKYMFVCVCIRVHVHMHVLPGRI